MSEVGGGGEKKKKTVEKHTYRKHTHKKYQQLFDCLKSRCLEKLTKNSGNEIGKKEMTTTRKVKNLKKLPN